MSRIETRTTTCTRCGTVVPWAPHCPHCSAYLEFSGNPPWTPDVPQVQGPSPRPEADVSGPDASPVVPEGPATPELPREPLPEPVVAPSPEELIDFEPLLVPVSPQADDAEGEVDERPSAFSRFMRGARRYPERQRAGYLSAVGLAVIVDLLLLAFAGVVALWALPLLVVWGIFVVGYFGTLVDGDEPAVEVADEEVEILPSEGGDLEVIWLDSDDELQARAPQTVLPVMERSRPLNVDSALVRDVACSDCDRMNVAGHRFCDRCGAVLADAVVAPPVVAVSIADREEEERETRRKQRRVSGSWRNPIIYVSLGLALLAAFVFAFLGPGALQTRIGLTAVFQVIAQFIDPYAGSPVSVETVTATSTLPGTDATQAGLGDTRTFWASAPSVGYGVGTTLRLDFAEPVEVNRLVIYPGIQNQQFDLRAVATPQDITLTFDDASTHSATLQPLDSSGDQRQLVEFPDITTGSITITIDSVYPPRGEPDDGFGEVAISGIQVLQTPKPPAVFQVQKGGIRAPALPGVPAQ